MSTQKQIIRKMFVLSNKRLVVPSFDTKQEQNGAKKPAVPFDTAGLLTASDSVWPFPLPVQAGSFLPFGIRRPLPLCGAF